jgi:hypothetical protein
MLAACATAQGSTYCAHTPVEFQSALNDAGTGGIANSHDNTIHLASGTFTTSGGPFNFGTTSGFALTIDGGYNSNCTAQDLTPGATALDGGGLTRVLTLQTNGTVTVSHVTIRNALYNGSAGGGGQIYLSVPAAVAIFDSNVVRDNADSFGSGGFTFFGSGTVHIENNLFVGNSSPAGAAFSTSMGDNSTIYITNNTITGNTNTGSSNMITAIGGGSTTLAAHVSNTISYGNHGVGAYDFYLYGFQTTEFVNNDYASITGVSAPSSTGNFIAVDPKFVGASDFHLKSTSPLLRAGTLTPAGTLPVTDIEGHPRSVGGHVDLGAYENVDFIFANGLEQP